MRCKVAAFGGGVAGFIILPSAKAGFLKPLHEIDRMRISLSAPEQIAAAAAAQA